MVRMIHIENIDVSALVVEVSDWAVRLKPGLEFLTSLSQIRLWINKWYSRPSEVPCTPNLRVTSVDYQSFYNTPVTRMIWSSFFDPCISPSTWCFVAFFDCVSKSLSEHIVIWFLISHPLRSETSWWSLLPNCGLFIYLMREM